MISNSLQHPLYDMAKELHLSDKSRIIVYWLLTKGCKWSMLGNICFLYSWFVFLFVLQITCTKTKTLPNMFLMAPLDTDLCKIDPTWPPLLTGEFPSRFCRSTCHAFQCPRMSRWPKCSREHRWSRRIAGSRSRLKNGSNFMTMRHDIVKNCTSRVFHMMPISQRFCATSHTVKILLCATSHKIFAKWASGLRPWFGWIRFWMFHPPCWETTICNILFLTCVVFEVLQIVFFCSKNYLQHPLCNMCCVYNVVSFLAQIEFAIPSQHPHVGEFNCKRWTGIYILTILASLVLMFLMRKKSVK